MPLIVFGIIVVIAVVFLIVFNTAASKKSRPRGSRPMPSGMEQVPAAGETAEPSAAEPVAESAAEPAKPVVSSETIAKKTDEEMRTDDQQYRQALRNFAGDKPDAARVSGGKPSSRDHEYRRALRSLDQQDK